MDGVQQRQPADEVFYPSSDGKPMGETSVHVLLMVDLILALRQYFAARPDVYAIGNIFLYWEEGNPEARNSPDIMVVKGVSHQEPRDNFKVWEEKAVPSMVLELTSKETADEDLGSKKAVYQRLGVKEYFLFDPLREYLERPLMGYRLVDGLYEPLPPSPDGALISNELMLQLRPEGRHLELITYHPGERLYTPSETHHAWQEALREVSHQRERAEEAERLIKEAQVEAERYKRLRTAVEQKIAEQEAELVRLRALLPPQEGTEGGKNQRRKPPGQAG
jgi:Uma2 family endonuclease